MKMVNESEFCSDARLQAKHFKALTAVEPEELKDCIRDKMGACYSRDGKRLLTFDNEIATHYDIRQGVEVICSFAFAGNKSLQSISIPESVTLVGSSAFEQSNLHSITLPDSILSIGNSAFCSCHNLTSCSLPTSLRYLGAASFANCSKLHQLVLPQRLLFIAGNPIAATPIEDLVCLSPNFLVSGQWLLSANGQRLIAYLGSEQEVTIPHCVSCIGDSALAFSRITSLKIDSTVTTIEPNAFGNCMHLTQVKLPDGLEQISDLTFAHCHLLETINIPATIKQIGAHAFEDCRSLTEMILPDSISSIGDLALSFCPELKNLILGSGIDSVGVHPLLGCNLEQLENHSPSLRYHNQALYSADLSRLIGLCSEKNYYRIPRGVQTIDTLAFAYRHLLSTVALSDSVEQIGTAAFACCPRLTSFKAGANLNVIGQQAFFNCWSLQNVDLLSCPDVIGADAFASISLFIGQDNPAITSLPDLNFSVPRGYKSRLAKLMPDYRARISVR
ncbi:MAG: leucine-rich repeat domain-containing protein [Prevotella sp.]|jgi:hypothetical protein